MDRYDEYESNRYERRYYTSPVELPKVGYSPNYRYYLSSSNPASRSSSSSTYEGPSRRHSQEYDESAANAELDPKTLDFEKLIQFLNPKFISEYLNRILTFLQSKNKEICFPNIAPYKEAFLVKLVTDKQNLRNKGFDGICRCICREIVRVLDVNKNAYRLVHSYESGIVTKQVLVYQKVYINSRQDGSERDVFKIPQSSDKSRLSIASHTSYSTEYSSNDGERRRSSSKERSSPEMSKKQKNFKALVDGLSEPFIMSSLQSVLDFLEDTDRPRLQLDNVTAEEARFLKSVTIFPHKPGHRSALSSAAAALAMQLHRALDRWRLDVTEGRGRRHQVKTVTMKKRLKKQSAETPTIERKKKERMKRERRRRNKEAAGASPRDLFLKALSVSDGEDSPQKSDKLDSARSQDSASNLDSAQNKSKRRNNTKNAQRHPKLPSYAIQFQPAGDPDAAAETTEQRATDTHTDSRTTDKRSKGSRGGERRRGELQRALRDPVSIPSAVRIMNRMGWEGGALGLRGEGITEPIMPAINIKSGAGLAYSPPRAPSPRRRRDAKRCRTPLEFRTDLLESILDLLRGKDLEKKEIDVANPITNKEKAFITTALAAINARKNMGLNTPTEKELVCRILANMNNNKALEIEWASSSDARTITLLKRSGAKTSTKTRRKRTTASKVVEVLTPYLPDNVTRPAEGENVEHIGHKDIETLMTKLLKTNDTNSVQSLRALAYRVMFLQKMREFVKSSQSEKTYKFASGLITTKNCKYIENIISGVNAKRIHRYSSASENELYEGLKKSADCHLKFKYTASGTYQNLTFYKIYYTKRFINTSTMKEKNAEDVHNNNAIRNFYNAKDEEYSTKKKDVVILSDSEDSVISLECKYDLIDEDDDDYDGKNDDECVVVEKSDDEVIDERIGEIVDSLLDDTNQTDDLEEWNDSDMTEVNLSSDRELVIGDVKSITSEEFNEDCNVPATDRNSRKDDDELIETSFETEIKDLDNLIMDIDGEESNKVLENKMPPDDNKSSESIEERTITDYIGMLEEKSQDVVTDEIKNLQEIKTESNGSQENYEKDDITDNCSPESSKRSRSVSESSEIIEAKRPKILLDSNDHIFVTIVSSNEDRVVDRVIARKIQEEMLKSIEKEQDLPLLKCHGIIYSGLVYECLDRKSYDWLENVVQKVCIDDITFIVVDSSEEVVRKKKNKFKMVVKTNSFVEESPTSIFKRIELYNANIKTENWVILDDSKMSDYFVFTIEIDRDSFYTICESNYSLYAGIDKLEFSQVFT